MTHSHHATQVSYWLTEKELPGEKSVWLTVPKSKDRCICFPVGAHPLTHILPTLSPSSTISQRKQKHVFLPDGHLLSPCLLNTFFLMFLLVYKMDREKKAVNFDLKMHDCRSWSRQKLNTHSSTSICTWVSEIQILEQSSIAAHMELGLQPSPRQDRHIPSITVVATPNAHVLLLNISYQ